MHQTMPKYERYLPVVKSYDMVAYGPQSARDDGLAWQPIADDQRNDDEEAEKGVWPVFHVGRIAHGIMRQIPRSNSRHPNTWYRR